MGLAIAATVLPIAGIYDWTTQAMGWRESTNLLRVLTGSLFSIGCLLNGRLMLQGHFCASGASLGVIALTAMTGLFKLYSKGAIDRLLAPMEDYALALRQETDPIWTVGHCSGGISRNHPLEPKDRAAE